MKHLFAILLAALLASCQSPTYDTIIKGATVYDGTGVDGVVTDVGIKGDSIAAMGDLSDARSLVKVDGRNLALAPGFIDAHSHHDRDLTEVNGAAAVVSQGITTIVVGQDGGSEVPLGPYFKQLTDQPVAINLASYAGHNSIRYRVLGDNYKRKATPAEIDSMKSILRHDMEAGALGLSTGLEYDPGIYSSKEEVLDLARVAAEFQGRYISHLRSEDRYFWDALQEIIQIGRETDMPVQISHFKLAMRGIWGKADSTLALLDKAREDGVNITADVYPYTYWSSTVRVLFPDRNFNDVNEARFILREVTTPEGIIFSNYEPNPAYNGRSLQWVADQLKMDPASALIEVVKQLDQCDKQKGDCDGSIVATSMDEADVVKLLQWPLSGICSDGASTGRHPRGFGAFTRLLSHYVRETSALSLPMAIHKMTARTAEQLGIENRGTIATGNYADLVLFDPATVADQSTIAEPQRQSVGIQMVWVNGKVVFENGKTTAAKPGKVLRRAETTFD
ncbi:MAG: D-aminoacylase [Cyclobacteriaceae bacterium]|nr:D-aminoacylase [Cyclobacteriaceae bacterium]